MSVPIVKYPRTPHLAGSRLQPGDSSDGQVAVERLRGGGLVVEEKIDGANCGLSFDGDWNMVLQSRGHALTGGPRERQFDLFKAWARAHEEELLDRLEDRYLMYGEWCLAKHTVFYDALPHYFLEFDVYDRKDGFFLSTAARQELLGGSCIAPVPIVHEGPVAGRKELESLIGPSLYKTPDWRENLRLAAEAAGIDPDRVLAETEASDLAEGLYVKHEDGDRVIGRYKFVRADFLQAILDSGSHWADRPIVGNRLSPGVDILQEASPAGALDETGPLEAVL